VGDVHDRAQDCCKRLWNNLGETEPRNRRDLPPPERGGSARIRTHHSVRTGFAT